MSFNYLEVERATQIIAQSLPDEVQSVEVVRFPLDNKATVPDINVALRLKSSRKLIVFSLKQPWTGLFFTAPQLFMSGGEKGGKLAWSTAFNSCTGPAQDWNVYLQHQTLERIETVPGDRVVRLFFGNGAELRIELFPARPNWVLTAGGQEFRWRNSLPTRPGGGAAGMAGSGLSVREFEALAGGDWMARAYQHYLSLRQAALVSSSLQKVMAQLQARLGRLVRIRVQMLEQLRESAKAEQVRVQAESLKAILHELPPRHKAKEVQGIKLDSKHSVADNVTIMFSRYKKLQRTQREVEARLIGIEEENKKISAAVAKLRGFKGEYAAFVVLVESLDLGLETTALPGKKESKEERKWREAQNKLGVRRFQSKDGLPIWVGRNHKENEELVIRLARGNDLWMHLKGRPGAHVIVQIPSGKTPSLDTLLDAATLAAYHSNVSDKEKVEIDYTYRKYVKRVPGGGDKFLVTYTQNKTLMVKIEDERLWRLLKQH